MLEQTNILNIIKQVHGLNFEGMNKNLMKRRLELLALQYEIKDVNQLINVIANDSEIGINVIQKIAPSVTEMFRDPGLFLRIVRLIKQQIWVHEPIRTWHAGCAKGLEVFSLAILLYENDLLQDAVLSGTDFNDSLITKAKIGKVSMEEFKKYTQNYFAAGGLHSLSDHFTISYNQAILKQYIRKKLHFSSYQLGSNANFQKYHVVFCRNVLYYYNASQQEVMLQELINSTIENGFVCLGIGESIEHLPSSLELNCIDAQFRIYQKKCKKLT
jgi:chemotaxis protein methyltransferase CheR